MENEFKILISPKANKDFEKLDKTVQKRISSKILKLKIQRHSTQFKALKGENIAQFRLRVGDYRVLYDIYPEDEVIYVLRLGHRKDIYR